MASLTDNHTIRKNSWAQDKGKLLPECQSNSVPILAGGLWRFHPPNEGSKATKQHKNIQKQKQQKMIAAGSPTIAVSASATASASAMTTTSATTVTTKPTTTSTYLPRSSINVQMVELLVAFCICIWWINTNLSQHEPWAQHTIIRKSKIPTMQIWSNSKQ